MKALTLTQPWATLVAIGAKQFETRSWQVSYRGALAIHAAKGLNGLGPGATEADLFELTGQHPFHETLGAAGITGPGELPRGAIIAVAGLAYCLPTEDVSYDLEVNALAGIDSRLELAFGNYAAGRFGWRLTGVRPLEAPVEIPKGAVRDYRGLWNVPRELEAALHAQIGAAT